MVDVVESLHMVGSDALVDEMILAPIRHMSAQIFDSGDSPFLKWMKANPDGYVLNTSGGKGSHYLMLHRSGCHHISGYTSMQSEGAFTTNGYVKVCANSLSDIQRWISANREASASFKPCATCNVKSDLAIPQLAEEVPPKSHLIEGAIQTITINAYERNPAARAECISHYGCICSICEIDFAKIYGPEAKGFIHVHHLKPISEIKRSYVIDPVRDLRPVCPNCHAVIHLGGVTRPIEVVKRMLRRSS
jgi:5-methylcytosine-specific restriction protein A